MLKRHHQFIRFIALLVLGVAVIYIADRKQYRTDVTQEGLSKVTEGTVTVIQGISADRPVTVHAFVSKEVPREYVTTRSRLMNILREMQAIGGEGLTVRIVEPELYSLEAEEAMENYGIAPRQLAERTGGRVKALNVFMGMAFVSGPREEVVPFMDRGLSVEYEVARALRVVTQEKKKVVGILRTDATIMGNFDIQTRRQQPAWQIVEELRKQYEVRSLNPKTPVPDDIDVLFVPQLASCGQDELDTVKAYVDAGRPALLTVDPMPLFDIKLSPREQKLPPPGQGGGGMFGGGGGPPPQPKGAYKQFLREVGVDWPDDQIAYDTHNPNPVFEQAPPQIIFVSERPDGTNPFANADAAVDGLSQVVVMYAGELKAAPGYQDKFTPLLTTSKTAGFNVFDDFVQRHPLFGIQGPIPPKTRSPITRQQHVLAARIQGGASTEEGGHKDRNLVVLADLDMFGNLFFQMHERGGDVDGDGLDDVRFDNVPFLLNLVDSLAGDDRFIALRKRRQAYRRLTKVDELTREARKTRQASIEKANKTAEDELNKAQAALDGAVAEVKGREDLDENTKAVMLKSAEEAENRRLQVTQEKIEREKAKAIAKTETDHRRKTDEIQNQIRIVSVLVPPIPALLLGAFIFGRKRRRESEAIPSRRRAGAPRKARKSKAKGKAKSKSASPSPSSSPAEDEAGADKDDEEKKA